MLLSTSSAATTTRATSNKSDSSSPWTTTALCCVTAAAAAGAMYVVWKRPKATSNSDSKTGYDSKDTTSSSSSSCIYLDYNGTTPIYPPVLQAMMPYLTLHYGNPSSSHIMGKEPRRAIDQARKSLLQLLGCTPSISTPLSTLWFTGCGTESDNLAIQLAIQSTPQIRKKHVVTCNVEHMAVEAYLKYMVETGVIDSVTYVPVDTDGRVSATDMIAAIQPDHTILVTLMLANNESGALQPVQQVAQACRERGILMHTDAAQAAGKVSVALADVGHPDMVSLVGHKLGAMKGIAALYVREGCFYEHGRNLSHNHGIMLIGGGQEFGRRGGTENTASIVGFGVAADLAGNDWKRNALSMERMRQLLLSQLQAALGESNVRANGPTDPTLRLPNTLSVGFKHVHSGDLLGDIGHQVAASAGATCHSAGAVSSVLRAMQVPEDFARGTLRLSLGPTTTEEDIRRAAAIIAAGVQRQWESKKNAASPQ